MRFHFVVVPIHDSATAEAELNQFLGSHRVVSVDRQFVSDGPRSVWAVCVAYADTSAQVQAPSDGAGGKKARIDYRETLSADQFQIFVKLRDWRKAISDKEAVPPYAVFTNEQLAEMVRRAVRSTVELGRIDGIGPSRIEKYGAAVLAILENGHVLLKSPAPVDHAQA